MLISFYFQTVDGENWTEAFDSLEEAKSHFLYFMGRTYDIGSSYAVNTYGDVTCTVDGASWEQLGL
jgi:hypothetical protein